MLQAVIAFTGIPAAFMLKEVNRSNKIQNPVNEIVRIIRYSLVTNKQLCYNIMYSGIIGAATLTMAWFVQPVLMYLKNSRFLVWRYLDGTESDGRLRRSLVRPGGQLLRSA